MNKRQGGTNSKESLRMSMVLEDPRWEKLVLGKATLDEVAELSAWAQKSRLARKAWDLYRPSTTQEKEAHAARLLQSLKEEQGSAGGVWRSMKMLAMAADKPRDQRMMSRHRPGASQRSFLSHLWYRWVGSVFERPKWKNSSSVLKPRLSRVNIEPASEGPFGRRNLTGTTSGRITLTKDAAGVSSVRTFGETDTLSDPNESPQKFARQLRQGQYNVALGVLVCTILGAVSILVAGDDKPAASSPGFPHDADGLSSPNEHRAPNIAPSASARGHESPVDSLEQGVDVTSFVSGSKGTKSRERTSAPIDSASTVPAALRSASHVRDVSPPILDFDRQ